MWHVRNTACSKGASIWDLKESASFPMASLDCPSKKLAPRNKDSQDWAVMGTGPKKALETKGHTLRFQEKLKWWPKWHKSAWVRSPEKMSDLITQK